MASHGGDSPNGREWVHRLRNATPATGGMLSTGQDPGSGLPPRTEGWAPTGAARFELAVASNFSSGSSDPAVAGNRLGSAGPSEIH